MSKANPAFEAWFNNWSPFFDCQWLYFTAFCLAALGWLGWSGPLNRAAFWLIAITFVAHTFALGARMYISGRPPVTNLYSSAIFIGWAGVLGGLILESVYRLGFGNVMAAVTGFATLLIADKLSLVLDSTHGDTIGVMQAVLDTQFWLATHVTCVTLGYTATLVAGLLGLIYVVRGLFTPDTVRRGRQESGPHDLRHRLLCDLLQLRGHGAGRTCGPTIRGAASGVGTRRKTAP